MHILLLADTYYDSLLQNFPYDTDRDLFQHVVNKFLSFCMELDEWLKMKGNLEKDEKLVYKNYSFKPEMSNVFRVGKFKSFKDAILFFYRKSDYTQSTMKTWGQENL